ncbi:MAG TPA: hypothetical protein VIY71_07510 [Solirubrobacterales bacterium]
MEVEPILPGEPGCEERGGVEIKEKEAALGTEVCTGEEGSPWTDGGVLPPGALETGTWSFHATTADNPNVYVPISFPIPVGEGNIERSRIHYTTDADFESKCQEGTFAGVYHHPNAAPGEVCIFADPPTENATFDHVFAIAPVGEEEELTRVGGVLHFTMSGAGYGFGSFAVRGCGEGFPCP